MSLAATADRIPIRMDPDGTARVGDTRVRLASVLHLYKQGIVPEEIHERFPSVPLGDIYGAIAYYLHHQAEVDAYLAEQGLQAERIRREIEARPETRALRETLLSRKAHTR